MLAMTPPVTVPDLLVGQMQSKTYRSWTYSVLAIFDIDGLEVRYTYREQEERLDVNSWGPHGDDYATKPS